MGKKNSSTKVVSTKRNTNGKAAKVATKVDAFGTRLGTKYAAVNAMVLASGKKPVAMKAIKAKIGDTFYNHLHRMQDKGFVVQSKEGFACTGKVASK